MSEEIKGEKIVEGGRNNSGCERTDRRVRGHGQTIKEEIKYSII